MTVINQPVTIPSLKQRFNYSTKGRPITTFELNDRLFDDLFFLRFCTALVEAMTSIKSLLFFCCWPDEVFGPLVSLSTDITSMVIASDNNTTLIVHPVIIPFSTVCHSVVNSLVVKRIFQGRPVRMFRGNNVPPLETSGKTAY